MAGLCITPALAEEKTYDNAAAADPTIYLKDVPGNVLTGTQNTFMPDNSNSDNTITIDYSTGTAPKFVLGGYNFTFDGNVENNQVEMKNGNLSVADSKIVGGYIADGSGDIVNNTVIISGGTVGGATGIGIYGGYADRYATGKFGGNQVIIKGGIVAAGAYVYGGYTTASVVDGNSVTIEGGTVYGNVSGGHGYLGATNNKVTITGGTLDGGTIFGGSSDEGGDATNNTITISGSADIRNASGFYGGEGFGSEYEVNRRTGNTLHIDNWQGSTKAEISNFEIYKFTLPATIANGDTLLNSGNVDLGDKAKIEVRFADGFIPSGEEVKVNLIKMGLIKNIMYNVEDTDDNSGFIAWLKAQGYEFELENGFFTFFTYFSGVITGTLGETTAEYKFGGTIYPIVIKLETPVDEEDSTKGYGQLTATWGDPDEEGGSDPPSKSCTKKRCVNQKKAGAYLYGATARLAALNDALDHSITLIDHWHLRKAPAPRDGPVGFASLRGSSIKTRTASPVDNHAVSLIVGSALDASTAHGRFTAGVFAEGGLGNYESRNAFADGNGDIRHYGAGAFGKFRFDTGVYLDASARAGRIRTDYDNHGDLSYESETGYRAAHFGVGAEIPLSQTKTLDTYGKVLWMRQDGDTVTTRAREKLSFDPATSLRSRVGARYVHTTPNGFKAWGGLAWEREFDGEVGARLDWERKFDGDCIAHRTKSRGDTGLAEVGVEYDTARWRVTAGVQGLWGKRQGAAGTISVTYRF
jgi:hypothetical protein